MKIVYQQLRTIVQEEGGLKLDLPELTEEETENLPTVSVVTVTNDENFISSLLYVWIRYIYPPKKLEWIVVEGEADVERYLPENDDRIFYHRIKDLEVNENKEISLWNEAVKLAKHDIIVHQTENSFYFPDSILAKVRTITNKDRAGILTWNRVNYNIKSSTATISSEDQHTELPELDSLAYRKKYWESRKLGENFIGRKYYDWMDIGFNFNGISFISEDIDGKKQELEAEKVKSLLPEKYIPVLENIIALKNL